ncbi:MAG: type IV pilus twitching motility protein PilT [Chitinispirillaceae bacterium]|nr:type IV pilus twitching motility protein PilT [Chitinispirillaceae bacterium]
MIPINALLKLIIDKGASDLHLRVGVNPVLRVNGDLFKLQTDQLTTEDMDEILKTLMKPEQYETFLNNHEFDFAFGLKEVGRFRINAYRQRGTPSLAIRSIKTQAPEFTELGLPEVILDIAMHKRGLILVTGTTGSGKSTLLASMIEHINNNAPCNIVTIEDPIEFLYKDKRSIIAQREIGPDTHNFANALRASFRQDPDIILIGEIRDRETIETALSAADTGHLVMSTLHTMNAVETISRIISFFPPHQHDQIRLVLSSVLVSIISLRLLPRKDGSGRVPAAEILINTANIAELILKPDQVHMILQAIGEGFSQYGSQTFDQSLIRLYKEEYISLQVAKQYASNPDDFDLQVRGVQGTSDRQWMM